MKKNLVVAVVAGAVLGALVWLLTRGGDDRSLAGAPATDAPAEGTAELFVFPADAPRHATTIAVGPGRRRVELPAGISITGRVEVNGGSPREPVSFLAETPGLPELDEKAWAALNGELPPSCTTSATGELALSGLKEGSEWTFFPQ